MKVKSQFKPIIVTHIDSGIEYFFQSIRDAKKELNVDCRQMIQGLRYSMKGYSAKLA
jgi:hypothetical protein